MWLHKPLNGILSSPARIAVLRAVRAVTAPLHGREIARRAGVGYSPAHHALQALVASGVLSKRDHGRVCTYQVRDPKGALVRQLRELFAEEDRRARQFVSELVDRVPEVRSIILFGSEARGDARPGSDTDLLIVVPRSTRKLEARLDDACMALSDKHGLALSWHVVSVAQVCEWDSTGEQFWRNVLNGGVLLHGDAPEAMRLEWRIGRATSGSPAGSGT